MEEGTNRSLKWSAPSQPVNSDPMVTQGAFLPIEDDLKTKGVESPQVRS